MSDSNLEADGTSGYDTDNSTQRQPPQSGVEQESITDVLTKPLTQAYVKAIVALYALLGAGMGLMVIFGNVIDQAILDVPGSGGDLLALTFAQIPISTAPYIAALLALFVGGYLGNRMGVDDRQTMITGAAGTLAGTVVLWVLSSFLAASQIDSISIDVAGLIVNGIVLGLLVGGIAAGTVYVMRNLVPDGQQATA
ncbi:hypothetical protein [Natronorubrum thiooxidans]|uniref:Major facilitator superfamily (MFS) profile domain-containing protein n=1 Tax=Natronorubrum thiooxidans TaxID=308853 RepID=A0A1N7F194_9EURY|nr:hypothetical protein [Natronorubrum thiooxidans]SIR94163.1 hypothetical protein SAMN05421752_105252 [Natronorubrum thiooxidans]